MNYRKTVPENIQKIFEQTFVSSIENGLAEAYESLDPIIAEVEKINTLLQSDLAGELKMKEIAALKANIYGIIRERWTKPEGWDFLTTYPDFLEALQEEIASLPQFYKEEQAVNRFKPLKTDKWHLKFRKFLKYKTYQVSTIPRRTSNGFRKLFKKQPKPIQYWTHKIPLQNVVRKVYQTDLVKSLSEAEKYKYIAYLQTIADLKKYENSLDLILTSEESDITLGKLPSEDSKIDLDYIKSEIETNKSTNLKRVSEVFSNSNLLFEEIMAKANTMELARVQLNPKKLNSQLGRINKNWLNNSTGWSRTLYVLFDDWRLDFEINHLKYFTYNALLEARQKLSSQTAKFHKSLVLVAEALEEVDNSIKKPDSVTKAHLLAAKNTISNNLKLKVIPEVIEKFDGRKLIGILRNIEKALKVQIEAISDTRALVKTELYGRALKEQDINYIQPNELISFEVFQEFAKSSVRIKNSVFGQLEEITSLIPDIDNIVLFSIETALNTSDKDTINAENVEIVLHGIGRAKNRLAEVNSLIDKLQVSYETQLIASIETFTADAVGLTQNENALSIRFKLLTAKALKQTKSYQNVARNKFFGIFRWAKKRFETSLAEAEKKFNLLRKRYFLQPSDAIITQEISAFLSESESRINELPTIYHRLYKVEPVTDMDLFIGREDELHEIESSFQNWQSDKSSATAIVGEKWGGTTSFLNFVEAKINFNNPVIRVNVDKKLHSKKLLYDFLAKSLSLPKVDDQAELIKAIKNIPAKKILIIENIQHLYLRTFHGFDAFRSLFEIINQTQRNIFWVVTCSQHAWNYLDKAIQTNYYFNRVVRLQSMNIEAINTLIRKRNQIGGFKIVFSAPPELADYKKFKTAPEDEQQKILEKRFFKKLNSFASNNISMALIFWLLSTKDVTDDQILISDFNNPDKSFIQVMSETRIYILLALVLHDGLTLEELTKVNNQAPDNFRLEVAALMENGIIVDDTGFLEVNPLIYQNVVSVLKSKNLIH